MSPKGLPTNVLNNIKKSFENIGGILTVIASLLAVYFFIDFVVGIKINQPEYIHKIAEQVRPFVIFNGDGVILSDGGALQYLDSLIVLEKLPFGNCFRPKRMLIKPKQFLQNEPVIQCLSNELFDISIKRIPTISWSVFMDYSIGPVGDPCALKFRLEIIR